MEKEKVWTYIDHTLLRPTAAWEEIRTLCDEAVAHKAASVCVPPAFVSRIHEIYGAALVICTVIGFPLGYQTAGVKSVETAEAVAAGAGEVDMVINLGDAKDGKFKEITREIALLKAAAQGRILKVIVETCYLSQDEKIALCECVTQGGADYIKTSTGFGSAGAALEDVTLFKKYIGPDVKIKAAGGISTLEQFLGFIEAGCGRIGTSRAMQVLG